VAPALGLSIPATLHDSLAARLDRLGAAKDTALLASVLGRDFSGDHLAAVSDADPSQLRRHLVQLEEAGFLQRQGTPPDVSYTFRHALIQEAAYQSLLKDTRRLWHVRSAWALEQHFPDLAETAPEALARHFEEGGLLERSIGYFERAAERATQRSANAEAIGHLRRALEVLNRLPASRSRDERELVLQAALASPLVAATGWGSVEAERAYARAMELGERVGETSQLFRLMRGVVTFYVSRAELATARELCTRLLELAEIDRESSLLLLAHQQTAIVLYYLGRPAEALVHYEQALALHDPSEHAKLLHLYGEDLGVFIRIWSAWALWMVGLPDRALTRGLEAIELARGIAHPFSLAYALLWTAVLRMLRRERRPARELAEAALEIGLEQGFAFHAGGGRAVRALAQIDPEEPGPVIEAAIQEFQIALGELARTGTEVTRPKFLGVLAEAYRKVDRPQEARSLLSLGTALAERTSQPFWDAELRRVHGELLLDEDASAEDQAEKLFVEALEIARNQKARSLELRAATSLGRLLRDQGRLDEARAVLAPVYASFQEGLELPDLQDAKTVLDALG
jgi:tetratricopeptide (TPR) repeat protein